MSIQDQIIQIVFNLLEPIGIVEPMVSNVIGTFLFLFGELVLLFIIISFIVALLQIYISKDKIQKALTTKSKLLNSILGGLLGSVTPFCSCSTIPLLVGLIKSKAPFAGMMSFLLTSPILNPAIIVLFLTFFGVAPTLIYASVAFIFAVVVGYILDIKGFDKYIKLDEVKNKSETTSCCDAPKKEETCCTPKPAVTTSCCAPSPSISLTPCCDTSTSSTSCCDTKAEESCCDAEEISYSNFTGTFIEKTGMAVKYAFIDSVGLFKKVFVFLLIGAGIGSFIYGFIPEDLLGQFAGANNFLAVPLAAVLGIPMYIRTETMIPIASVLVAKGVGLGTMVALIIGGAGASIPEVSLLGSIFKKQLVITFLLCIFAVATITGFAFNLFLG